jgi:hypothetical protein
MAKFGNPIETGPDFAALTSDAIARAEREHDLSRPLVTPNPAPLLLADPTGSVHCGATSSRRSPPSYFAT